MAIEQIECIAPKTNNISVICWNCFTMPIDIPIHSKKHHKWNDARNKPKKIPNESLYPKAYAIESYRRNEQSYYTFIFFLFFFFASLVLNRYGFFSPPNTNRL